MAAKAPTSATKIAATLGGLGLGALAISTKNIMSNITSAALGGCKKNTYINLDLLNLFSAQIKGSGLHIGEGGDNLFNLTGNSALDLIHMLVLFQLLQLLFLSIIIYNSIIMLINEDYIEKLLLRFVPLNKTIRGYILNWIKLGKKSNKLMIIIVFILLLFANLHSYYYLDFVYQEFDGTVEAYIKNKTK